METKQKKSKGKIIVIILLVILLLGNLGQGAYLYKTYKEYDALRYAHFTSYMNENAISVEMFYSLVDSGDDCLVYIHRPACPVCRDLAPGMHDVLMDLDLMQTVYYLDVESIRPSGDDPGWEAFKARFGDIEGTPSFLHLKDGKTVAALSWPGNSEDVRKWLVKEWVKPREQ